MKKLATFMTTLLLFTMVLPVKEISSAATISKSISFTVVLKDQSISKSFKDYVVKNGGKMVKEFPQLGAVEVTGSPELINTLQKNTLVKAVGPAVKMKLPKVKTEAFTQPSLTAENRQNMSKDLVNRLGNDNPSQPNLMLSSVKPTIRVGDGGGEEEEIQPYIYEMYQWDIKRVTNYGASFKNNRGSHNVVVGIIDTGVDYTHPDLSKNYLGGRNYVPANANGDATETGNPEDVLDRNGHGSHVAGSVAGKGLILGVAPDIGYKAYRVFGAEGGAPTSTIVEAILGATDDGVDVINMSLGGYSVMGQIFWTDPSTGKRYNLGNEVADFLLYKRAVKYATDHGITVVAASGNDGMNITAKGKVTDFLNQEYAEEGYSFVGAGFEVPGLNPGVITVSATGPMDTRASYSNYGPGSIDITAPGGDAQRYNQGAWYLDLCLGAYKENGYIFMGGTSMATPKVSAVAALLINKYGKVGPQKIAQMIRDGSQDVGEQGKDQYFGNGMVQAPYEKEQLPAEVDWHKEFGGIAMERGANVHQTNDGGFISVGASVTYSTKGSFFDEEEGVWKSDVDLLVVKTGKDGRTEWYRPLGSGSLREWGNDVTQTKDGGYVVLGYSGKNDGDATDVYLAKLSASGETQWEKTLGEAGSYQSGFRLLQIADGGFVITGTTGGNNSNDIFLMKVDSSGNKIWEKTYGGQASETASSVKATRDGGYIIAGQTYSVPLTRKSDFFLVKVDGQGNPQWEKKFGKGDSVEDFLHDVVETETGDFVVAGESQNRLYLGGFFPKIVSRSYFAKIGKTGDIKWEKYTGMEDENQAAMGLTKTPDGKYIAAGWKEGSLNPSEVALWKFNDNGEMIWEKLYGGFDQDFAMSIESTKDGGYVIMGFTHSYTAGDSYDSDMYLLKLNSSINN